jgi:hypothetical protein
MTTFFSTKPLQNISSIWLFFAVILVFSGGFPLLQALYFERSAQTGVGVVESVSDQHHKGGKFSSRSDVYDLKIKYQQPPLDQTVNATAGSQSMWSADEGITFLYNPKNPGEIKLPGFLKHYIKNEIWLISGILIFIWWFLVKIGCPAPRFKAEENTGIIRK